MSEMWLEPYNDGTAGWTAANFKRLMLDTWDQLKPFYRKLHAYVRMKLRQDPNYEARIKKYGYIPANLMGNMWAQDWAALENRTKPYPNVPSLDATEAMKRKVRDCESVPIKISTFLTLFHWDLTELHDDQDVPRSRQVLPRTRTATHDGNILGKKYA